MHKPTIGLHHFKPRPTEANPLPAHRAALVCGINPDGTVNLVHFCPETCEGTVVDGAVLVQDSSDCPCHYTEPEPVPEVCQRNLQDVELESGKEASSGEGQSV